MSKSGNVEEFYALAGRPEFANVGARFDEIREKSFLLSVLDSAASFFLIIDFSRMEYLYVSKGIQSITGFPVEQWKANGVKMAYETLYAPDAERFNKMLADQFDFIFSLPVQERKNYKYTKEFRVVRSDGNVIWMMANDSIIELDENGKPAIALEICSDITQLKKDQLMRLTCIQNGTPDHPTLTKQWTYPLSTAADFTPRELQVLGLRYQGMDTKAISSYLSITALTVRQHRKNLLRKSGTKNTPALIRYGLEQGLLP